MDLPRILGGEAVRKKPFPDWPMFDEREKELLLQVLESRRWGGRRKTSRRI